MKIAKLHSRSNGSALAFAGVLALVLMIIGIGFFAITMYMGGQRETKNAVDSGMLNVGKQVLDEVGVPLFPVPNQIIFADVNNSHTRGVSKNIDGGFISQPLGDGDVTLRRINRIWAKALLIAMNADAADKEGYGGSGPSNAQEAFDGAESISNRLYARLMNRENLYRHFDNLASQNSVRMLGTTAKVSSLRGNNWQTSLMARGKESNITVAPPEYTLPPNYTAPDLLTKSSRKQISEGGKDLWFLQGYKPIKLAGRTFWQVPFPYNEKPHLVSGNEFNQNTKTAAPIGEWEKPLPNSFSGEGRTTSASKDAPGQKAMSWVLTNPNQPFKLSLPHSFVRIKLDKMETHWYFFPIPPTKVKYGDPQEYKYKPDTQAGPKMPLGGPLCFWVKAGDNIETGLDVAGRPLDHFIFGAPGEGKAKIESYLLNRVNQMIGKAGVEITKEKLHDCLSNPFTIAYLLAEQDEFYLFSADGESLEIMPKYLALIRAPWLALFQGNDPDGTEMTLQEDADCLATLYNDVSAKPFPKCIVIAAGGWGLWDKAVYWTPGSGYNACLGNLRVKRWTEVYSLGIAVPSPF